MRYLLRLAELLWMLVFMIGAMALVIGGVYAWLYPVILIAEAFGGIAGLMAVAFGFWFLWRYQEWVVLPWDLWLGFWRRFDKLIELRLIRDDADRLLRRTGPL